MRDFFIEIHCKNCKKLSSFTITEEAMRRILKKADILGKCNNCGADNFEK